MRIGWSAIGLLDVRMVVGEIDIGDYKAMCVGGKEE